MYYRQICEVTLVVALQISLDDIRHRQVVVVSHDGISAGGLRDRLTLSRSLVGLGAAGVLPGKATDWGSSSSESQVLCTRYVLSISSLIIPKVSYFDLFI